MAIHKLDLTDFHDADYCLFAIHSDLEDFQLAHAINSNLKTEKIMKFGQLLMF